MRKFRLKIQEIEDGKKKTIVDEEGIGYLALLKKEENICCEFGGCMSDADLADITISSKHLMEIHKMVTAYKVAECMGLLKDPEDDLADKIRRQLQ